jgi:hypothetical protein
MGKMNRAISTLAYTVAILIWTGTPTQATFKGTLRSDTPVTVEFTAPDANSGGAAVAVYYLDSRGLDVEAVFRCQRECLFRKSARSPEGESNASSLRWMCLWEEPAF